MADSPRYLTLTPDEVGTITFGKGYDRVEVMSVSGADADEVWFTTDGSTPAVATTGTHCLPAGIGAVEVAVPGRGPTVVNLLCGAAALVQVRGVL